MKFAAILGAAAVLTAGAASAAEIGVRHTWGTSDRVITHGRFVAETKAVEGYVEGSKGWSFGGKMTDVTTNSGDFVQSELPSFYSEAYNANTGGSTYLGGSAGFTNDSGDKTIVRPTEFVGSTSDEKSFAIGGSKYGRLTIGGSYTTISESYDFTGSETSGFSELSTFSR